MQWFHFFHDANVLSLFFPPNVEYFSMGLRSQKKTRASFMILPLILRNCLGFLFK